MHTGDVHNLARPLQRSPDSPDEGILAEELLTIQLHPDRRQALPFGDETRVALHRHRATLGEQRQQAADRQPPRIRDLPQHRPVAAPRPLTRIGTHPGADRIERDMANALEQKDIGIDQDRRVALELMVTRPRISRNRSRSSSSS